MSSSRRGLASERQRRWSSTGTRLEPGGAAEPGDADALYVRTVSLLQQGEWQAARDSLAALTHRYPGSTEVDQLQQTLAFRLSAEETWAGATSYLLTASLRRPAVRRLLAANAVVYAVLLVVWLLGRVSGLL